MVTVNPNPSNAIVLNGIIYIPYIEEHEIDPPIAPETPESDQPTAPAPKLADKEVDWTFLKSTRFYAGILASTSVLLLDPSFPTNPWYYNLGKFLGILSTIFIGLKTIDRVTDKVSGM